MLTIPPTRFPGGVSTAIKNTLLGNLPFPNPLTPHLYVNDFDTYAAGDWTVTTAGGGSTALTAGDGGLVLQTTGAAGADIQHNLKNPAAFQINTGRQFWFAASFQLSTLSSILQLGVQTGGTALAPTDGVYFTKATGVGALNLVLRAASTSTTIASIATLAAATRYAVGFYYDGLANPTLYAFCSVNSPSLSAFGQPYFTGGDCVAAVGALNPTNTSLANLPTATNLALSFGIGAGAAAAETMTTDYIFAANEILRY